jgi:hypothetical protein
LVQAPNSHCTHQRHFRYASLGDQVCSLRALGLK